MKCTDCAYYKICKSLNNTGIFAKFPKVDFCPIFEPNSEEKDKESEKKKCKQQYQPRYKQSLQIEDIRCWKLPLFPAQNLSEQIFKSNSITFF